MWMTIWAAALGQVYVAEYFSPEAKQAALKMVLEIEAAMQSEIQTLPWMGAATKEQALTKLHSIANKIGYPDTWRDYSSLQIAYGDEVGNAERASWFEFHRWLAKIGQPVDRNEWGMTPPTVNAYYDPQKNDINFPAGVLQPPLFSALSDAAPNYGDTGATMGHELTHAFDDEGSQFDAQGNLRNWWTEADRKEFERRAQCVVDQYSGYTIFDDIKINGKLTNGEDLADLGGTLIAYLAWKEDTQNQKLEPLDGLTPEQRFFVAYGQSWCSNVNAMKISVSERRSIRTRRKSTGQTESFRICLNLAAHFTASPANQWSGKTPAASGRTVDPDWPRADLAPRL